ncbi:MAG: Galactokinase [Chloroflexi bacterium ADurb.Bin325]|nr:MAG: Galactokinase [Chloroflexi bacterium ADurb.Bin325]
MSLSTLFEPIYGDGAAQQAPRYAAALAAFARLYGAGDVAIYRAPGRVNLIGEHTDYNHGFVLPAALDKDAVILARPRPDATVRLANVEEGYAATAFDISPDIPPDAVGAWSNYVRGAAQALARTIDRPLHGFDGLVVSAPPYGVPRGSGLSSSSALTVAAAVTVAHLNGLGGASYDAHFAGIMDHFASVLGRSGHAMFLDCRPMADGEYRTEHVPLPEGYRLLVVDSGVHHRNVGGGYNQRVAECRAGVGLLQARFPGITHLRDVQEQAWDDLAADLPEETTLAALRAQGVALDDLPGVSDDAVLRVRPRCRHVWTENRRVLAAMAAMIAGDVATLGGLLNAAHASARDDYEISCPEIETLVDAAREVDGVAGARLTGAGWGGCMVALVAAEAAPAFERHVVECYRAATGRTPGVFVCRAGPGAGFVGNVGPGAIRE